MIDIDQLLPSNIFQGLINSLTPSAVNPFVTTSQLGAVTNLNTNKLLGRFSAGLGTPEEITIGTGLALSGLGVLSATGVASVSGTLNRITSIGGVNPIIDIDSGYIGQNSITTLGTVTTGVWQGTAIIDAYISSAVNWNTTYTNRITSLTTVGSNGASTLIANVLNIPNYTLAGLGGTTLAVVNAQNLSVFAPTTSAQLANVISDETGTGQLVFNNTPTLIAPALGTPTNGIMTNVTGLPLTTGITGVLAAVNGGTGFSFYAIGDILYANTTTTLAKRSIGSAGQVFTVVGGLPTWVTPTSITASNGLNKVGNDIRLGGALTSNTSISGAFQLSLTLAGLDVTATTINLTAPNAILGDTNNYVTIIGGLSGGVEILGTTAIVLLSPEIQISSFLDAIVYSNLSGTLSPLTVGSGLNYTAGVLSSTGVSTINGTLNRIVVTGGSTPTINISTLYAGQSSITTLGTISTGVWNGTAISDTYINSAANWNSAYANRIISLTVTGSSGASTLVANVLNIPTYTLSGLGGTTLATVNAQNLSVFAATTSAQLASIISDETGTGALVFANSPVLITPNIGNATGNISGNSATVTTNANLTGVVTSVGNVTSIAANAIINTMINSVAWTKVTGTPTTLAGYGIADAYTIAQTNSAISAATIGLLDDRGNFDASVNAYPSTGGSGVAGAILKGDLWTVSISGTLPSGLVVTAGDVVRALTDNPGNIQTNWAIGENNFGYVALNQALASGNIYVGSAGGIGTSVALTGNVTISNTGVTIIGAAQVTNAMLVNSSITINTGVGLSGGGVVALGGTLSLTNTKYLTTLGLSAGVLTATLADTSTVTTLISTTGVTEGTNLYFTNARARAAISLTTVGSSGASTYSSLTGILNIPIYSLAGMGGVASTRALTINGLTQDLSADRTWTITTTGTLNRVTVTGGAGLTPTIDIAATYIGQSSITTLGTITTGVWNGTSIANAYLANSSITIGTTTIPLGGTSLTLTGLTSVISTSFVGALTGNASTATALQTARTINGVSFDGTANIVVTAAAGTLTGTTLNPTVVNSSLTSVGTLTAGSTGVGFTVALSASTITGTLFAVNGGTGQSSYLIGDMLYANSTTTLAKLPISATAGDVLTVAGGVPTWAPVNYAAGYATYDARYLQANNMTLPYKVVTVNNTALATDYTLDAQNTLTQSFLTAVGIQGRIYVIKNSGNGVVTLAGFGGQPFDGVVSPTILAGNSLMIQSNNINWTIIG